jgi:hypothetical protein
MLIPVFESMGSVVQTIGYIVLFIVLPALVYSCKSSINKCHAELKRQNHLLHGQARTLNELNFWMQYFDEKMIKRENKSPETNGDLKTSSPVDNIQRTKDIAPKKQEPLPVDQDNDKLDSTPASIYKKTI